MPTISQRRPRDRGCAIVRRRSPRSTLGASVFLSLSQVTMMANLKEMSRVLYSHDWARVQDWVTALDQLATLNDDEIAALVHQAARQPASSVPRR